MKTNPENALLPNYFKVIAYAVGGMAIILPLLSFNEQLNLDEGIFLPLGKYSSLLAIFFFTFSKEKNESKFYNELRIRQLTSAIMFSVGFFILHSVMDLFYSAENRDLKSAFEILMIFHIYYLVSFQYYKYKEKTHRKITD